MKAVKLMSKLDELIQEYCPDGVEYKKVKDVFIRLRGTPITAGKMKEIANENGNIRIFAGGKTVIDADEDKIENANIIRVPAVLVQSRGIIDVIYYEKPFTFKSEMWAYTSDNKVTVKYLYYVLKNNIKKFRDSASGMGSLPQISLSVTEDFQIPLPPLPVQEEIIRILDNFTDYTEKLKTELDFELTARKKQYEYYRDKLLMWDKSVKTVKLEELFPFIRNGFVGTVTPYFTDEKNGVRYIRGTNIHDGVLVDNDYVYINKEFHQKNIRSELKSDDILVVQSGHVGDCARVGEKYKGSNCHALIIMTNGGKCDSQYVVYYLQSREGKSKLEKITTGGTVKHILASAIKKLEIPIPPLETQKRIVHVLDNFEKICSDLNIGLPAEIEARQKQYEYYRDALLTFAAKGDIIVNRTEQNRTEQNTSMS